MHTDAFTLCSHFHAFSLQSVLVRLVVDQSNRKIRTNEDFPTFCSSWADFRAQSSLVTLLLILFYISKIGCPSNIFVVYLKKK